MQKTLKLTIKLCKRCNKKCDHPLDIDSISLIGMCMRCEAIQDEIDHDKYWADKEDAFTDLEDTDELV